MRLGLLEPRRAPASLLWGEVPTPLLERVDPAGVPALRFLQLGGARASRPRRELAPGKDGSARRSKRPLRQAPPSFQPPPRPRATSSTCPREEGQSAGAAQS